MAVYCAAFSVIVRNSTLEARYPGGVRAFGLSRPNETFCTDGTITRVGFMVESDARSFVAQLAAVGIVLFGSEATAEVAVTVGAQGFLYPCDWLQLGLFDGRPATWLAGTDRGNLFMSQLDCEHNSSIQMLSNKELRESYDFVGVKNGVESYRHKKGGELLYIGRTSYSAPGRRWWQVWK